MGGSYASVAEALLVGIHAARDSLRAQRVPINLRILNSGPEDGLAWARYQEAVAEGANLVIGPLSRDAVSVFAAQPMLPVPVLALNEPQPIQSYPPQFFRLTLDPESEASQVAREGWAAGYQEAVILALDAPLGQRLVQAFEQTFASQGGIIRHVLWLAPEYTDFHPPLAALQRGRVDSPNSLIFLATNAEQAHLLWPQWMAVSDRKQPVWATSHVFSGQRDVRHNAALNGLRFLEIPALIAAQPEPLATGATPSDTHLSIIQDPAQPWPRVVALGHDALLAGAQLATQTTPGQKLQGWSGHLILHPNGRISRQLSWAYFVAGQARPLPLSHH